MLSCSFTRSWWYTAGYSGPLARKLDATLHLHLPSHRVDALLQAVQISFALEQCCTRRNRLFACTCAPQENLLLQLLLQSTHPAHPSHCTHCTQRTIPSVPSALSTPIVLSAPSHRTQSTQRTQRSASSAVNARWNLKSWITALGYLCAHPDMGWLLMTSMGWMTPVTPMVQWLILGAVMIAGFSKQVIKAGDEHLPQSSWISWKWWQWRERTWCFSQGGRGVTDVSHWSLPYVIQIPDPRKTQFWLFPFWPPHLLGHPTCDLHPCYPNLFWQVKQR